MKCNHNPILLLMVTHQDLVHISIGQGKKATPGHCFQTHLPK